MQTDASKVLAHGAGKSYDVFGVRVEILLSGEETGGAQCAFELHVPPGGGPPPHLHLNEDESFYVLEGEFDILNGEEWSRVGPGSYCYVPVGTWHTFRNAGNFTGRVFSNCTPAGHEHFFIEVDTLSRNGLLTPEEALAVCERHGMQVMVPATPPTV